MPETAISDFIAAHGGDGDGAWVGFGFGCNGDKFDVDALKVVTADEKKVINFEPRSAKATLAPAGKVRRAVVIAGGTQKLKATLKDRSGKAIKGKAKLLHAANGSKKYRKIDTIKLDKTGTATVKISPVRSGSYKLKYAGTKTRVGSTSKPLKVAVHTNVRAHLASSAVVQGNPFVVSGRFWPGRSTKVWLQHYTHKKWSTVRKLRSAKDGTFRVSGRTSRVGKSYWRIFVPPGGGNLNGRTPAMKLTTKPKPKPPHHGGGNPTPTNPTPPTNDPTQPNPPTGPV